MNNKRQQISSRNKSKGLSQSTCPVFVLHLLIIGSLLLEGCVSERRPTLTAVPQKGCDLTLATAPSLQKLRLGMSFNAVRSIVPSISKFPKQLHNNDFGELTIGYPDVLVKEYKHNNYGLEGVDNLYLEFVDNKLIYIYITYENNEWYDNSGMDFRKILSDFEFYISKEFGLPNSWQEDSDKESRLACKDFDIKIGVFGGVRGARLPTIELFDRDATDALKAKQIEKSVKYSRKISEEREANELRRKSLKP